MLSHDEERSLAELEARLRDESPELVGLFTSPRPDLALARQAPVGVRLLKVVVAVVLAVGATIVTTLLVGPDLGGLVGALALPVAGLVGWRQLGSCPAGSR